MSIVNSALALQMALPYAEQSRASCQQLWGGPGSPGRTLGGSSAELSLRQEGSIQKRLGAGIGWAWLLPEALTLLPSGHTQYFGS